MALNKNIVYKPKDALIEDGRVAGIKSGRGRLPAAAIARIHELVAEGYKIIGYEQDKPKDKSAPKVVRVKPSAEKVVQEYIILYPESMYKAIDPDGKERGMAEVCNHCMVSLVQCHCDNPTILGDIPIKIVPRA